MYVHEFPNHPVIRKDVRLVMRDNGETEVWADEDGQHGIIATFDRPYGAVAFAYRSLRHNS